MEKEYQLREKGQLPKLLGISLTLASLLLTLSQLKSERLRSPLGVSYIAILTNVLIWSYQTNDSQTGHMTF